MCARARVRVTPNSSVMKSIFAPELQTHFGPASESEGAEKDADDVEVEDGDFGVMENVAPEDTGHISGVSTLSSAVSHDSQRPQHSLGVQLTHLKQETSRYMMYLGPSDG